jgi:hypothetical protein
MSELDWLDDEEERGLESATMTNADKIRSMDDKKLADFIASIIDCWHCPKYQGCTDGKNCANVQLAWLKQEYKENSND